jgi:hypothetical protein
MLRRHWAAKEADQADKAAERHAQGLSAPVTDLDEAQSRIDELEARLGLRGDSPRALPSPDTNVITPSESDITPPGEIGEFYRGKRYTPDDLKVMRPKPVIDHEPAPPKRTQPGSITEAEARAQGLHLARHDEPWRPYVGGV